MARRLLWCLMSLCYVIAGSIILVFAKERWHVLVAIILWTAAHNWDEKLKTGWGK